MGAGISSTVSMGLTYCCCSSASSLCHACLGGTTNTTGRKRSVLLVAITVAAALFFQYALGPYVLNGSTKWYWSLYNQLPGVYKWMHHTWVTDYCSTNYEALGDNAMAQCVGNAGVYRPTALASLFFGVFAAITYAKPDFNQQVWPAKLSLFCLALVTTLFLPNAPLFTTLYLPLARMGATVFVVLQQVILIDVAYNWNESWVEKANISDSMDYGSGRRWLQAILGMCALLYSTAFGIIIWLYQNFMEDHCPGNTWIVTMSLLAILAITGIQLSGTEGSLLTSSVVSLYVAYLAFASLTKNPSATCNPHLGQKDSVMDIVIGLTLTAVSLAWTGWSWSAQHRLNTEAVQTTRSVSPTHGDGRRVPTEDPNAMDLDAPFLDEEEQGMSGIVTESWSDEDGSDVWKLNIVLMLISCWVAMSLTGWGSIEYWTNDEHSAANPQVGHVNMIMICLSQWVAIFLYGWTILAPRLFPERDFS